MMKTILLTLAALLMASTASAECQVISGSLTPHATVTWYWSFWDHGVGTSEGSENAYKNPIAMVASNLSVTTTTAPGGSGTRIITLRDDAADTSLTCTLSDAATSCVDVANTPTIAALSRMTVSVDPTGTPTASTNLTFSFCLSVAP